MATGPVQLSEELNCTVSAFNVLPSTQLITMRSVASVPLGASFAMSTEDEGDRSSRPPPPIHHTLADRGLVLGAGVKGPGDRAWPGPSAATTQGLDHVDVAQPH